MRPPPWAPRWRLLDRAWPARCSNDNTRIIASASVTKLFASRRSARRGRGANHIVPRGPSCVGRRNSHQNDGAAESDSGVRTAMPSSLKSRADMSGSTRASPATELVEPGSSAPDPIRYDMLSSTGRRPLDPGRRHRFRPGPSPHRPGSTAAQLVPASRRFVREPVAVSWGWMCCIGSSWMHLSTGVIGAAIMVIESLARRRRHRSSNHHASRQNISQRGSAPLIDRLTGARRTQKPPRSACREISSARHRVGQVGASFARIALRQVTLCARRQFGHDVAE